jgi:cysteinyl-tRNA synthetase
MAVVQEVLKSDLSDAVKLATIRDFDTAVLGLELDRPEKVAALPDEVAALADQRVQARAEKNWALSDQLRDEIQAMGYAVNDTPEGQKVYKPE